MKYKRFNILNQIKKYTLDKKYSIFVMVMCNIFLIPLSLLPPKLFQVLIDDVINNRKFILFFYVAGGLLSIYFLNLLFDSINLYFSNKLLNHFTFSLRKDIWNKYFSIPYITSESISLGDMKMRFLDDIDRLGNFIQHQVVDYYFSIFLAIVTIILSLFINIKLTFLCLLIIPIVFVLNFLLSKKAEKINEEVRVANEDYYSFTYNSFRFWREIKVNNKEEYFSDTYKSHRNKLTRLEFKSIRNWAFWEIFNDFKVNYVAKTLAYILGVFFVIKGEISVGKLIMFAGYYELLFSALDTINYKRADFKMNLPYYSRVFEILSFKNERMDKSQLHTENITGDIKIRNLSFTYPNTQKPTLKDINFTITSGDYTAIIGKSGHGKTTLIKLMLGLYHPTKGCIKYGNTNISQILKPSFYSQVSVVMQDSFLFNMSIKDNLLLAKENATEEDLISVCKKANIYHFINKLEKGFNTNIGENGSKLSGGQKQRLILAQALLKKPKVLILDEATKALDKKSETAVLKTINELSKTITVIVIAHKPEAILDAKKIITISNGEVKSIRKTVNNN